MKNKPQAKRLFYGWYIVAASFLLMATAMGISLNCNTLFITPISAELQFNRSQMAMNATLISICSMLVSLFSLKLFKRFGLMNLMKLSAIMISLGFLGYSFADHIGVFYLLSILIGISYALLTNITLSIILSNWFEYKRGLAIGIAFMGSALGGMLFTALTGYWLENWGWRFTYRGLAIILAGVIIPVVFFIIREKPEDLGLQQLRIEHDWDDQAQPIKKELELKDAFSSPKFWIVTGCILLTSYALSTLLYTIAPHLVGNGYSLQFSANVLSVSMGLLAAGKLVMGKAFDKLGTRKATLISSCFIFLGLVGMILVDAKAAVLLIILGVGLGAPFGTIGYQLLIHSVFDTFKFSAIYGFIIAFSNLGGTLSPIINGAVFDATGNYNTGIAISALMVIFSGIVFQISLRKDNHRFLRLRPRKSDNP